MRAPIDLYELLPAVYRLRDAERGEPLRALLGLVSEQAELLRDDLDGSWDDQAIETCAEWVVPYIGDLVANTPLYEVPLVGRRADVAETIRWRRRKGTLAMLGALARGVTGWGAHAVATFELLGWNQNLNHLRMQSAAEPVVGRHPYALDRIGTVDVRSRDALDRVGGAFETITHNVDVRRIADDEGWYGLRKVCFFCFRLTTYPLQAMTPKAVPAAPRQLFVSPLGHDAPLFHLGSAIPAEQAFATEINVDAPIRAYRFFERPQLDYGAGDGKTLLIRHGSKTVPLADILCKDLGAWAPVPPDKVGVDVRRGRIRIGSAYVLDGPVLVDAAHGFSAPIGGGPYAREPAATPGAMEVTVSAQAVGPGPKTLEDAVAAWKLQPAGDLRIVIDDSATYTPVGGTLDLSRAGLAAPVDVTIVAHDGQRPVIVGDVDVGTSPTPIDTLTLDGVLVSGAVRVQGPVRSVTLRDCTLVPGHVLDEHGTPTSPVAPSLVCDEPADRRDVVLERCITGPLRLPAEANHLALRDCVVDAPAAAVPRVALDADGTGTAPGPETSIERSTVLGALRVRQLTLASESIFVHGTVVAERRQTGCVRFSWVEPDGSSTPRRYECQPDLVCQATADPEVQLREIARVRPNFSTTRYGQPAYMQLSRACAPEIAEGAQDRAEMGAFHLLLAPYRETNLRVRLEEYLPFGLEPGIVHVT